MWLMLFSLQKKYFFTNNLRLVIAIALGIMAVSAVSTYLYAARVQTGARISNPANAKYLQLQDRVQPAIQPPEDLKTLNVLLLGYGGAGHQGGYLTDVIQVAHFDFETGLIKLISIPRDLWVSLPNGKQAKINQAFTLGENPDQFVESGAQAAKKMAQVVTGLPLDYYVAVDFVGFQRFIGEDLGGIEVDVPETLEDPWYPIRGEELNPCGLTPEEVAAVTAKYSGFELEKQFECRYEQLYFKKGLNHMEGGDALKYVRSRHGSAAGDFSRSQRQQAVLAGIRDKLLKLENLDEIPTFFQTVSDNLTTDLDLELVKYLTPALQQAGQYELESIIISTDNVLKTGKSTDGQFILLPKQGLDQWDEVRALVGAK